MLASQAFTALIPLLLLASAWAPADNRDIVSVGIIRRFQLSGGAADAVRQLFAHSSDSATGVLSVFLLFFSGVSLTRRMQRMYQQAWGLEPSPGVGRALNAAFGLTVLVLGIGLLYLARTLVGWLPAGDVLVAPAVRAGELRTVDDGPVAAAGQAHRLAAVGARGSARGGLLDRLRGCVDHLHATGSWSPTASGTGSSA